MQCEPTGTARLSHTGHAQVLLYCLGLFLASRFALEIVGIEAQAMILPLLKDTAHTWSYSTIPWSKIWGVWDTGWYIGIVDNGYMTEPYTTGTVKNQANWAFFFLFIILRNF